MTITDAIEKIKSELGNLYSIEERDQIIALIFEELCGFNRIDLRMKKDENLSPEIIDKFSTILKRLITNEPIQYTLGFSWFAGMKLKVNQDVLIPRQETEELVDWIVKENKKKEPFIIDFCTGSGCIALALKKNISSAELIAIDISQKAIQVATENATSNGLIVSFHLADILNSDFNYLEADIIVSNPPYVKLSEAKEMKPNVLKFEPHQALFVPDNDPLIFYKRIAFLAKKSLNSAGKLYLEINENLSGETAEILELQGFHDIRIRKDLNNKFRMISSTKP